MISEAADLQIEHLENIPWGGIGSRDCYALGKDFFEANFPEIPITDFVRPHDWDADRIDLLRNLYTHDGFKMITDWEPKDLRPADIICMSINSANPNHIAVYLGEGDILHHLYGRMSRREPFHGSWRNRVSFILRHPEVPDLRTPEITLNLEDFVRAKYSFESRGLHGEVRSDSE